MKESLQPTLLAGEPFGKTGERPSCGAYIINRAHSCLAGTSLGLGKHIPNHVPNHVADERPLPLLDREAGMTLADRIPQTADERQLQEFVDVEKARTQAIVDVMIIV